MVPDVKAAVEYYEKVLGFTGVLFWEEDPRYAMFPSPGIELREDPELAARVSRHMISVYVEAAELDAGYEDHRSRGARIIEELADKPWRMRQYLVEDLNGYILRFGGAD